MKTDWWSCDGAGHASKSATPSHRLTASHPGPLALTRRSLLMGGTLAAVGWASNGVSALADLAINPGNNEPAGDVLVTIFLRGGADGLNIVPPYGEDAYHRNRPVLGVASPGDSRADAANRAIDLDGFFGFHPTLAPLVPLFHDGRIAVVHACGSGDQTLSHFEAMATMERGLASEATGTASGWIARHLTATEGGNRSPLRAVALSSMMPASLRGATSATAVNSLADFRLLLPESAQSTHQGDFRAMLKELYGVGKDEVSQAGRETLAVLDTLNRIDPEHYRAANGAVYPVSELGNGLKQVACLIRGHVGLEVACLDRDGWDMHYGQNLGGWMAAELTDVGKCLAAFHQDLGADMNRVTLVVMTEFGRRLQENKTLGTDHGHGSMMFAMGGGVNGGRVYRNWPGLEENQLDPPGNLKATTDYRDVLTEILARRMHNPNAAAVFPEFTPKPIGIARA